MSVLVFHHTKPNCTLQDWIPRFSWSRHWWVTRGGSIKVRSIVGLLLQTWNPRFTLTSHYHTQTLSLPSALLRISWCQIRIYHLVVWPQSPAQLRLRKCADSQFRLKLIISFSILHFGNNASEIKPMESARTDSLELPVSASTSAARLGLAKPFRKG